MKASTIVIVLCLWVSTQFQAVSLEKQAYSLVQRTPASELDPVLPNVPFTNWFNQLVGPRAGVIWQLSECGEVSTAPNNEGLDLPACLEANASLPDGRKVVIAVLIGTYKKGLNGRVAFRFGVVEQDEQLNAANRLSELPQLLSSRREQAAGQLAGPKQNKPVKLPAIDGNGIGNRFLLQTNPPLLLSLDNDLLTANLDSEQPSSSPLTRSIPEDVPPPPPPDRPPVPPPPSNQPQSIPKLIDNILVGNAIARVEAVYPPTARMMGAFGTVKVQVTISETGRVIEAKAVSGHQALRPAAVEAALKWVFKPTTVNGTPIKVQGILNFNFKSSP
jgi:TonB family protein